MAVEIISQDRFKLEIFDFTNETEFQFKGEKPIVLNFFAGWCGPCHMFAPTLERIEQDYTDSIKVYKVDIDRDPELATLFEVRSVPTTIFIKKNEEPALASGALSEENMRQAMKDLFQL